MDTSPQVPALASRLGSALSVLARGLLYPGSESDTPYEPFHAALAPSQPVDEAALRSALRLAPGWTVELGDGEEWFAEVIAWARDPNGGNLPADADRYELLRTIMRAVTSDGVLRLGVHAPTDASTFHKTRRIVCIRLADGSLAGLLARSVET